MDKRANNSCSTPILGDPVKDYSLPLSRIDSTSSDNKSNSKKCIFNRKRKRCTVNNFVRYKSVRFRDSDADTEDNWITDWEESLDSDSKNGETSDDKKTFESTDDSIKLKHSKRKVILKNPTITRNSRYSSTGTTSRISETSREFKRYKSPELIRDAVHVDNLFLEKFDQPSTGTSNHHSQKYTPSIDVPIHSEEEGERCKGDEILQVDKLPLQLPGALQYPSSDDEFSILSEFMKHGDWKTYEKRPAIVVNKRKEIPSKNKTITQTDTIKWIYPKYWLSTANRLWNKFKELYTSSSNDSSAIESGSLTYENFFNPVTSDTSESLNTSSERENDIRDRQNERSKRFGKRISANKNINSTVNIRSVDEATKPREDDKYKNKIFKNNHIRDRTNEKVMSNVKKILKRNYKRAIPISDDDDSSLEFEIKKPRRRIQKSRKVNPKVEKHNDNEYVGDSMISDEKDNPKFSKRQRVEVEEDGPWRYDCKDSKVRMELKALENISVESLYGVEKKMQLVVSVPNSNKRARIISVEKVTTRYALVSGQSKRLLGSQNAEDK